jgi:hypothetical protein
VTVSARLSSSPVLLPSLSSVVIAVSHFARLSIPWKLGSEVEVNLKNTRARRFFRLISGMRR